MELFRTRGHALVALVAALVVIVACNGGVACHCWWSTPPYRTATATTTTTAAAPLFFGPAANGRVGRPSLLAGLALALVGMSLVALVLVAVNRRSLLDDGAPPPPDLKRPFVHVYDDKGRRTRVILVEFMMNAEDKAFFDKNRHRYTFVGITSYMEFPNTMVNPHDVYRDTKHAVWKYNYREMLHGWLYCFRDPARGGIPPRKPQLELSESDFVDYDDGAGGKGAREFGDPDQAKQKKYDFIYLSPKSFKDNNEKCNDDWTSFNKNWGLAKQCLTVMCKEYDLKGLLIGRENCSLPNECHDVEMDTTQLIGWHDLQERYKQCRFIFVPGVHDASPRVITEAMAAGLPVLLNRDILGGWKYVVPGETGELFSGVEDLRPALERLLGGCRSAEGKPGPESKGGERKTCGSTTPLYRPRQHVLERYGAVRSGVKLLRFVREHFPGAVDDDAKYLTVRFPKPGRAVPAGVDE